MGTPNTHTFASMLQDWQNRLIAVERRLARTAAALPGRLQPLGQEVVDWNDAVEVGFYSGAIGIPNAPTTDGLFAGVVTVSSTGRVAQELWNVTIASENTRPTFRRIRNDALVWTTW